MKSALCFGVAAGAFGLLPIAAAQSLAPDPTRHGKAAPPLRYDSAFAVYTPWQDPRAANWRAVNDAVRDAAAEGHGQATHGGATTPASTAPSDKSPASPHDAHVDHGAHGGRK